MINPLTVAIAAWLLAVVLSVPAFRSPWRLPALAAAFLVPLLFGAAVLATNGDLGGVSAAAIATFLLLYGGGIIAAAGFFSGAAAGGKTVLILTIVRANPGISRQGIIDAVAGMDFEAERSRRMESSSISLVSTGTAGPEPTLIGKLLVLLANFTYAISGENKAKARAQQREAP